MSNAVASPTKQELEAVFSRLRAQPANKSCFDCSAKAPTWSSVTYGVFICIDCSAVHRSLGVHLTFVRSTNLDTNWTWAQLRQMQLGGNANAAQFFRQHNCVTTDSQQKYNSRAAQLYRDKLASLAQNAMKIHGTKLHLDNAADKLEGNESSAKSSAHEEEDFFAQCENNNQFVVTPKSITPTPPGEKLSTTSLVSGAPSVDLLNAAGSPATVASTFGVRKIQPKKSGIGARKGGGLGATKVKTNFAEIEQRANMADQCKDEFNSVVPDKPQTAEEELESVASMRLAYQDLSMQKTREEAKLKTTDPEKAKQMERLGMGFSLRGTDVSHSAVSDMETIQQTAGPKGANTQQQSKSSSSSAFDSDSFFMSPTMYSGVSKIDKHELEMMGFETIESIGHSNITSMFAGGDGDAKVAATSAKTPTSASSTRKNSAQSKMSNSSNNSYDNDNAAQKKFGSSKGFGSDQFFGSEQIQSTDRSANLSRFQGSNSISSSDYFDDSTSPTSQTSQRLPRYSSSGNFITPDMDEVKASVRVGVRTVADRLSNMANDVMSSLQDKYGY